MKVVVVKEGTHLDRLEIIEKNCPAPLESEVKVRWRASSLNYHDYMVAMGALRVESGRIPMSDGAGEVIAVGNKVGKWKLGDKVMSLFFPKWEDGKPTLPKMLGISGETMHGFACEESCVDEGQLTKIPSGYSFAQAATLPCAAVTAWRALIVEGKMQAGETVLIEGTGGMSIFAMQIALSAGAQVFATTSSEEKAERLVKMGVSGVVNYKEDAKWGKTIRKMTGGGVDQVLDVGGSATFQQSVEAVKIGGHISSIGLLGGPKGEVVFPKLFFKQVKITGLAVGSRVMQEDLVQAINVSGWEPIIDKSFPLEEIKEAFKYQALGKHFGKIVLDF